MRKQIRWKIFAATLLAGAWWAAPPARADAPPLFTYQGRLKESGLPVTGARNVTIQICTALVGGTCINTGLQGVSVNNGVFRTTFTIPGWDPTTAYSFLEVQTGPAGGGTTPLSPREQLTSSPYALLASSATTLIANSGTSGVTIGTSVFITGGNLGIGTNSPTLALSLGNSSARTIGIEDAVASNPGYALTIKAGNGGTSGVGGDVTIAAGTGTGGNNSGAIHLQTGLPGTGAAGYVEVGNTSGVSHLRSSQGSTPSFGASACGTGANPTVNGTDMAGTLSLTAGTGAIAGCTLTITYSKSYANPPKAVLISANSATATGVQAYVSSSSNAAFSIAFNGSIAISTGYTWSYIVIE